MSHSTTAAPATSPDSTSPEQTPALGVVAMLRWVWTQLTSMRTALALLFLLALAAIPGSLIPQESATPIRVSDFKASHRLLNRLYEPLGMYSVYTSPWFSAIYLLLFVSLIGCIVPRIAVYVRALRTPPPRMPSRLDRLPEHGVVVLAEDAGGAGAGETSPSPAADPDRALADAERWLRRRRYRVVRRDVTRADGTVVPGLSAERGYLRELGNIVFHVSTVFVLAGVAVSSLFGYKGSATVVTGQGFSNTITQYDEFHAGPMVNTDALSPFTVVLKKFLVTFEAGPVQTGAARSFDATVDVTADGTTTEKGLTVNHPLTIDGTKVHLISHGYAVNVTVRDGNGNVAFSGPVVMQPTDGNFRSLGVIKVPDARPQRLAFQGFFLPTATIDQTGPHSVFPDALNPQLFLNVWAGAPRAETGVPENVFVLDTTGLSQVKKGNDLLRLQLKLGQQYTLPNGLGTITFDGYTRWAKLQISSNPGLWLTVASVALAVAGLCLSLFIRPRRLWIRIRPDAGGTLVAEAGGLDRADARTGLADDVAALLGVASGRGSDAVTVESSRWESGPVPPAATPQINAPSTPDSTTETEEDPA